MKVGPVCFLKVTFCNRVLLVYTLWEPLHFLEQGYDFQTWALSPKIRFEELGQYFPPRVGQLLVSGDKVRFLFLLFVTPCELILTARSVLCCSYLPSPGENLSFCGSHFLPNYGRRNPWSRRALLFFMMFFQCWDLECFYIFVCAFYLFIYSSTWTLERHSYKISYHDAQEVESGFGGGNKNYQGVYLMSFFHPKGSYICYKPKADFFFVLQFRTLHDQKKQLWGLPWAMDPWYY